MHLLFFFPLNYQLNGNQWIHGSSVGFPVPWAVREMDAGLGDAFVLNVCSIHRVIWPCDLPVPECGIRNAVLQHMQQHRVYTYRACVLCCIFTYTSLSQGKLFEYYCSPPP